ncbi:MAG: ankyrin repeat domain-containing protein, partial [Gammaproteobacteria bacterium]|nr:ankyrin repeat domain-containing protein [Gammaproteobacteria bacterium]
CLREMEHAQKIDIGLWWSEKLKLANISDILARAEQDYAQFIAKKTAEQQKLNQLCRLLEYGFKNKALLQRALTRKTAVFENPQDHKLHNEQLEFFGDSIFRMAVDDVLMELYPSWNECQLSNKRDELVAKNGALLRFAAAIELDRFIIMGRGELGNFQGLGGDKILSDVMEAVIGAIFNDCGKNYQTIKTLIIKHCHFQHSYNSALIEAILARDVKRVEMLLQAGADPNTIGSATVFNYSIGEFDGQHRKRQWGEDNVTLSYSGYEQATALELALHSSLAVPPIALQKAKSGPGRIAYIENGYIYSRPLELQTDIPTMEDVFATIAPIDMGKMSYIQCLTLEPSQPGYRVLQKFFENSVDPVCLQIMQLLLTYGADPNKKLRFAFGKTVLHEAADLGNIEAIELLLRHNADVTITDSEGKPQALIARNSRVAALLTPVAKDKTDDKLPSVASDMQRLGLYAKITPSQPKAAEVNAKQKTDGRWCTIL